MPFAWLAGRARYLAGGKNGGKDRATGMDTAGAVRPDLRRGVVEIIGVYGRRVCESGESRRGGLQGAENRGAVARQSLGSMMIAHDPRGP